MPHLIRYKLKPDRVAENERLVAEVFAELVATRPPGLRYAVFRFDDGTRFAHLVAHASEADRERLTGLPAFRRFVEGIRERCEEPPARAELSVVGGYGIFEEVRS